VSDEHYISVLLAARGEAANCACSRRGLGQPVYAEWGGSPHPKTFNAEELSSSEVIARARTCPAAAAEAALAKYESQMAAPQNWTQQACRETAARLAGEQAAAGGGTDTGSPAAGEEGEQEEEEEAPLPPYQCNLTLRKADPAAAAALLQSVKKGLLRGQKSS
jgi:hypothetical protein